MGYLRNLYGNNPEGFLAVWHKQNQATIWFAAENLEAAERYMAEAAASEDVYFGWGLQAEKLERGRGKSATVVTVPGVMMDVDLKSSEPGIHSKDALPNTLEEVEGLLEEIGFPAPTAIRHSGNGLYLDWYFDQPERLVDEQARNRIAGLSKAIQKVLIREAREKRGWDLDNTSDLARVTRMPGTQNHKSNPSKPVRLLREKADGRYAVGDLEAAVRKFEPVQQASRGLKPSKLPRPAPNTRSGGTLPKWESILAGCSWAKWVEENAEKLPEPHWYALATILVRCTDGEKKFHELSCRDTRYSEEEADAKLKRALSETKPRTCGNIRDELGHEGCKNCPFYRSVK